MATSKTVWRMLGEKKTKQTIIVLIRSKLRSLNGVLTLLGLISDQECLQTVCTTGTHKSSWGALQIIYMHFVYEIKNTKNTQYKNTKYKNTKQEINSVTVNSFQKRRGVHTDRQGKSGPC